MFGRGEGSPRTRGSRIMSQGLGISPTGTCTSAGLPAAKASRNAASNASGVDGAIGAGAETFGEFHEVRVGQVGGDQAVAVLLLLDAADIAERAVVEHHRDHRQAMAHGGGEFLRLIHEAAIAGDQHHAAVGHRRLRAEGDAEAPAEIVLIAAGKIEARRLHRESETAGEADLRDVLHENAVLRQGGADRAQEAELRTEAARCGRRTIRAPLRSRPRGRARGCARAARRPARAARSRRRRPARRRGGGSAPARPGRCRCARSAGRHRRPSALCCQ